MPAQPHSRPAASIELLHAKLAAPRLPADALPRTALLDRLDSGLARKLTLIAAPAGFGKTTLAAAWTARLDRPAAWVTLDAADNDPIRFWRYLFTAGRALDPNLGKAALTALRRSNAPALEALLTRYLNELAQLPRPGVLVLDDYHLITAAAVHDSLAFLLEHLPPSLHVALLTRGEPPLPLARLRARSELSELGAADLRFTLDETQAFLEHSLPAPLPREAAARLEARTEGWAAGLRLLALAAGQGGVEQLLGAFSGSQRHVVDYLSAEVLAAQPVPLQRFMLETSFLQRLTAALCEAVTGRADSAAQLEQLERAGLFASTAPLAGRAGGTWYRYHALFAEALRHTARQRLGEPALRALQARASGWYAARGLWEDAIASALAAEQLQTAAALIEQWLERQGLRELHTLRAWAEQLPPDVLRAHPTVSFYHAMAILFTSDRYAPATAAAVEPPLALAETVWRQSADDAQLGRVLALRAVIIGWQGGLAAALDFARAALQRLPEDDTFWRGIGLLSLGIGELLDGQVDVAQPLLIEARALCGAAGNDHGRLAATFSLGEVAYWQGEHALAREFYQQVLAEADGVDDMLDDEGAARLGLCALAYEQNDLAGAEPLAAAAMAIGQRRHDEDLEARAAARLARILHARGELPKAQALLHGLAARLTRPAALGLARAEQARLALAAGGDPAAAEHWRSMPRAAGPRAGQEREALLAARVDIVQGRSPEALAELETWQADAHANGRLRTEIESLVVQALAAAAAHDAERAEILLLQALGLARPKGFRRLLLDEGAPLAALLAAALPRHTRPALAAYAGSLLRDLAPGRQPAPASAALAEPLSPQERRVLRLLTAGLSNAEIASELVVSTNTIKTQLQSIYRKLNVTSRDEAQSAARELNLL